ncbi:MAG TPA: alpha/beta family hydrolase [Candidatus Acidoferrales bacterium]|nr:alpha/beta family hydrolase [Candidatus Acidoferrales bacterium]
MARFLFDGPPTAARSLVLAHGAGAPMDSPFMNKIAEGVAGAGIRVVRFEFPYMRARRETGARGAPDPGQVLMQSWRDTIAELGSPNQMVIGGKSLGGRIASMVADEAGVLGLVCLGYPFHPPRRPEQTRVKHLQALRTPALILQGTRDTFGLPEEIGSYALSPAIGIEWLEDGDHSFKPRVRSGRTEADHLKRAIKLIAGFIASL